MKRQIRRPVPHSSKARLDADVLWIIFSLNTLSDYNFTSGDDDYDITTDRALITARFTSQVCRLWRSVMLSSPEIWGNSLNFKYLEQRNDNWRNEVLGRTGTAPLSIIARDLKNRSAGKKLLFSLFEREAGRIRRVHTSTDGFSQEISKESAWTKLFLQEAPNLEIVSFRQYHGTNTSLSKVFLFDNRPSNIHTFIMQGFTFFLPGPWNESLRHLKVLLGSVVNSLVPALACMPKLESLHLEKCEINEDVEREIILTLPNIRQFHFDNDLKSAAAILDHIPPTEGLTSNIIMHAGRHSSLPDELTFRLHTGLVQHMRTPFSKELHLDMNDFRMILTNRLPLPSIVPINPTFFICIFMEDNISCLLLDTLSNGPTSTITHLDLSFEHFRSGGYGRDALDISIARLLASLQSVEVLQTTINDMPILTQRLHNQPICFMRLHTLVLKPHTQRVSMALVAFIKKRHSVGFPLRKIEIKGSVNVHKKVLQYLRESGLTFVLTVLPTEKGKNRSKWCSNKSVDTVG